MGLYYLPFWTEIWWKDYKVQSLPRDTRLTFYDFLFLLWDRDMRLANDDAAISYYLRISEDEWRESKRLLIKADLIQAVTGNKYLTCHRLGMEYDRIIDAGEKQRQRANKRWTERKKD